MATLYWFTVAFSLQQLCLRCCCLGDAFCEVIGPALASNTTLISLDLCSNQITDEGVKHLAKSLRLNRELVSLCLSANRIGDEGVNSLCQVQYNISRYIDLDMVFSTGVGKVSFNKRRGKPPEQSTHN